MHIISGMQLIRLSCRNTSSSCCCRGGIPICFPNWGPKHGLPTDGFLKDLHWSVAEAGHSPIWAEDPAPQVTLIAESNDATLAVWPHQFEASYTVRLGVVLYSMSCKTCYVQGACDTHDSTGV